MGHELAKGGVKSKLKKGLKQEFHSAEKMDFDQLK